MRYFRLIGLTTILVAGAAQAEVTGTLAAVSDYDFRGISQTMEDPALQGSIDWANDSGWYAGVWGSNVDFGDGAESNIELDGYFGYAFENEEGLGWDVGLVYYSYWPDDDDINYPEVYAGINYKGLGLKLWYTNDYIQSDESAMYFEGNYSFTLPKDFSLDLHAGHYSGDGIEGETGDSYIDYSLGVSRTFGNLDLALKYVDTDIDDPELGDGRLVFSISTTFPWGK
jgi:uncharacterized protein (TIGR02001 family)